MSNVTMNIATRALLAHQASIDVIGNNIANANTPGYVRRVAHLASTFVDDVRYGSRGTGVELHHIERKRASFLLGRYRAETSATAEFDTRQTYLSRVETALGEPSDTGVSSGLDAFFSSWSALANEPGEIGHKQEVVSAAGHLSAAIRRLHEEVKSQIENTDAELVHEVDETNRLLAEVQELNIRIREFEVGGQEAMGLRDRRDMALDQLSEKIAAQITEDEEGFVRIHFGGRTLVDGTIRRELVTQPQVVNGEVMNRVYLEGDSEELDFEGGRLGALQDLRGTTLPGYLERLDAFAASLITEVNAIHETGLGGQPFFTGTDAATIDVSPNLVDDASVVNTGDGNELALQMVALQDASVAGLGDQTFSEHFQSTVVRIGGDATAAKFGLEARRASLDQVQTQREQIEAVSLDEEMANMIAAEHAYQAAARLLTVSSEMLETLISIG